jgi:hypothetical protein
MKRQSGVVSHLIVLRVSQVRRSDQVPSICSVEAILEGARELDLVEAVADACRAGAPLDLGAGLAVEQAADVRARAQVPAVGGRQGDAARVGEAGQQVRVLVPALDVDARAVGEPCLRARDEAPAA